MATPGANLRLLNRSALPSGPDFFSGGLPEELDDDEHDGALRAAASLFAVESDRLIRSRKYPHLAVQGLLTSVRLLELLDHRKTVRSEAAPARGKARR